MALQGPMAPCLPAFSCNQAQGPWGRPEPRTQVVKRWKVVKGLGVFSLHGNGYWR